jgi:predicted nucleotidyltransferase
MQKEEIRKQVAYCLSSDRHIRKIVVFGSFIFSENPADIDIAAFQDSCEVYLPLSLKYRKKLRKVAYYSIAWNFFINFRSI